MVITTTDIVDCRGLHKICGYLSHTLPEHGRTINFDQAHYGPVSGGGATPGDKGVEAVVGAGVYVPVGNSYGGPGVGTGTGREGGRGVRVRDG